MSGAHRYRLLPASSLLTSKNCSRKTIAWAEPGWPPPKSVSSSVQIDSCCLLLKEPLALCRVGLVAQSRLSASVHEIGGVGSQGVTKVELAKFIRPVRIHIWLCEGRAQHRQDGGCLEAAWEEDLTQGKYWLSFQPPPRIYTSQYLLVCLWYFQSHFSCSRAWMSAWEQLSLSPGLSRGHLGF